MRHASRFGFVILAIGVGMSGCASNQRPAPPPSRAQPPSRPPIARAPALSSRAYVEAAAAIDLFEIRASELALRRAGSARTHDFARTMISAHKGTSAQLSFAGRRLNILPSAELPPKYRAMLAALASTPEFDSLYRQQQLAIHEEALRIHGDYAARGESPTLRPVAAAAVPIVQRHLRLLASI